jgi:hypothetical protein
MYTGYSGETYVYACYIIVRVCICGKILFYLRDLQKGTSSLHKEMEKGLLSNFA